jgi:hypothetical protein
LATICRGVAESLSRGRRQIVTEIETKSWIVENFRSLHFPKMMIWVGTVTGRRYQLEVELNHTILLIKEEIQKREGIDPQDQRILYHGRAVSDETTIEEAKIGERSMIHMIRRKTQVNE